MIRRYSRPRHFTAGCRTGIGLDWERLLSSAFIASSEYGTRSSTVVLVGRDAAVTFVERGFGPQGTPAGEVRYAFRLEPADRRRDFSGGSSS